MWLKNFKIFLWIMNTTAALPPKAASKTYHFFLCFKESFQDKLCITWHIVKPKKAGHKFKCLAPFLWIYLVTIIFGVSSTFVSLFQFLDKSIIGCNTFFCHGCLGTILSRGSWRKFSKMYLWQVISLDRWFFFQFPWCSNGIFYNFEHVRCPLIF